LGEVKTGAFMRVGVLGVNHKLADLQLREVLAKRIEALFSHSYVHLKELKAVPLLTCNRTEVYFSSEDDLADSHTHLLSVLRKAIDQEFDQKLYSYFGLDCFTHLCRVTAGLDSAVLLETEIQGQVKKFYESCKEKVSLPYELHYLFQKALATGKKVRSGYSTENQSKAFERAIYNRGRSFFEKNHAPKVLFIGASEINGKMIAYFRQKKIQNITLCNRSLSSAEEMASLYKLNVLPWENLKKWQEFEWIIAATKSFYPLIKTSDVYGKLSKDMLLIDLGVPRNIDPALHLLGVKVVNIDELHKNLVLEEDCRRDVTWAEGLIQNTCLSHVNLFYNKLEAKQNMNLIQIA